MIVICKNIRFTSEHDPVVFDGRCVMYDEPVKMVSQKDDVKVTDWASVKRTACQMRVQAGSQAAEWARGHEEKLAAKEKEIQGLRRQKEKMELRDVLARADYQRQTDEAKKDLQLRFDEMQKRMQVGYQKNYDKAHRLMQKDMQLEVDEAKEKLQLEVDDYIAAQENYGFNPVAFKKNYEKTVFENKELSVELCALKAEMKEMKAEHAAALAPYEWVVNRTEGLKDVLKKFKGKR